jgi:polyisoprenoid-binding protein YceI
MSTTEAPTAITRTLDGVEVPVAGTYAIDASHTEVVAIARHLVFTKVRALFPAVSGTVVIADDPTQSSAQIEIDVASVDTRDAGRDEHLRSPDFFDVENHPTITFVGTGVRAAGNGWVLDGDLTILGNTRPVSLDVDYLGAVTDPWGGQRIAFTASVEVDREEWGLTWNQALETGGVVVSKKITIEIDTELVHQQ